MRKLGLVGGIGPMSTLDYYRGINDEYRRRVRTTSPSGDNPPIVIDSLNLAVAYELVDRKDWSALADWLLASIDRLHAAGAQVAAMAANTAHIVFEEVQERSPIPLIGLVDQTCSWAAAHDHRKVLVLGTRFTMASGMYQKAFRRLDIDAVVPHPHDQDVIHDIIFPNLEAGIVLDSQKRVMLDLVGTLIQEHGVDACVLGCTELPLMLKEGDLDTVFIDTTQVHVTALVDALLD